MEQYEEMIKEIAEQFTFEEKLTLLKLKKIQEDLYKIKYKYKDIDFGFFNSFDQEFSYFTGFHVSLDHQVVVDLNDLTNYFK